MLSEIVNQGLAVFARCRQSSKGVGDDDVAPLYLYLHLVEMLDGVDVLVSQSCPLPGTLLLRSAFEAMISLEYILKEDTSRRSRAWLFHYVTKRRGAFDVLDPESQRGKSLRESLEREHPGIPLPSKGDIELAAAPAVDFLGREEYEEVKSEIAQYRRDHDRRSPRWYALFGGPTSIELLARAVEKDALYQVLYRHWSGVAHAEDISRFITRTPSGQSAIRPLRDPLDVPQVATLAASVFLDASNSLLGHFRPSETYFRKWYLEEIAAAYAGLSSASGRKRRDASSDAGT
jgi:hypothetical protein